jgi:hypothetical protein
MLFAHGQLLRLIWAIVGAGEVADESLFKVKPTINTSGWHIVQPNPGWTFKHLWHNLTAQRQFPPATCTTVA